MAEFAGTSGNIPPQIMLLAAWESKHREREREKVKKRWSKRKKQAWIVYIGGAGLKTTETERERNLWLYVLWWNVVQWHLHVRSDLLVLAFPLCLCQYRSLRGRKRP